MPLITLAKKHPRLATPCPRGASVKGRSSFLSHFVLASVLLLPAGMNAALIFQADFKGTGTGTGGAADMVTFGGTGSLATATGVTNSIAGATPFGGVGGNYLSCSTAAGAAVFLPLATVNFGSVANSFAALQGLNVGSYTTLNGAFDVFFRPNAIVPGDSGYFRPVDTIGGAGGEGLRLIFNGNAGGGLVFEIHGNAGDPVLNFTGGPGASHSNNSAILTGGAITTPGQIYHAGFTLQTDATGLITMRMFLQPGTGPIETNGTPLSSATFRLNASIVGIAFDGADPWTLREFSAHTTPVSVDYDTVRLYDSDPGSFPGLTLPSAAGYPPPNDPFQPLLNDVDANVAPPTTPATLVHVLNSDGSTYKTVTGGEEVVGAVRIKHVTFKSVPTYKNGYHDDTMVYAMIAAPASATPSDKYPGILLLHGGSSSAQIKDMYNYVLNWANAGYVAVACDIPSITGDLANVSNGTWRTVAYTSINPYRYTVTPDLKASWSYTCVGSLIKAFSLLKTHPNADTAKLGVAGASWGGYSTTILCGLLGNRIKAGFSLYGSGFYDEDCAFREAIYPTSSSYPFYNDPEAAAQWLTYYDAGRRTVNLRSHFYIAAAANDWFFRPPAVERTLFHITGASSLNFQFAPNNNHAVTTPGGNNASPKRSFTKMEETFFDYLLKGTGVPLPVIKVEGTPTFDGSNNMAILFSVTADASLTIQPPKLYYSPSGLAWQWPFGQQSGDRTWVALSTAVPGVVVGQKRSYSITLPASVVSQGVDWYLLASDVTGSRSTTVSTHIYRGAKPLFAPPALLSTVSRKTHGATDYDLALPLAGATAVECRAGAPAGSQKIVLTFDQTIVSGSAAVTAGAGSVGAPAFNGATMTLPLTGATSPQTLTVTTSNVTGSTGNILASASIPARMLEGDVNGDGVVNAVDLSGVRNAYGKSAGQAGFAARADLNVDGVVNSVDTSVIRTNYGKQAP